MDIKWIQIYQMVSTLVLLLWRLGESVRQENEEFVSSACFYEQSKALVLNCTESHMVKLNRIFYGTSDNSNACSYEPGHCIMDLPDTEIYPCIGRSECQINLPSGESGKNLPKCQQYSTYAQANYQCVPAEDVIDICSSKSTPTVITGQSGYIVTPRYPNNYPESLNCKIKIATPHQTQRIKLYIIDLILERNGTDCSDWLEIFDGHRSFTYCGTRARMDPITLLDNTVELNFQSSSKNKQKGFWLYYEAIPFIEVTSVPTIQATVDTTIVAATTSRLLDAINGGGANIQQDDKTTGNNNNNENLHETNTNPHTTTAAPNIVYEGTALTIGAAVGVIISLLLVITVIILVILLCYKRKDNQSNNNVKVPSSTSCNSEAAFLHFTNNCYPQNNLNSPTTPTSLSLPPLSHTDYVHRNI